MGLLTVSVTPCLSNSRKRILICFSSMAIAIEEAEDAPLTGIMNRWHRRIIL